MAEIDVEIRGMDSEDMDHILKLFAKAQDMSLALWDLDQEFRSMYKHQDIEWAYEARNTLHEILDRYNIILDDL